MQEHEIEMSSAMPFGLDSPKDMLEKSPSYEPIGPSVDWVASQKRKKKLCVALLALMVLIAVVYVVGGVYMSDSSGPIEQYDDKSIGVCEELDQYEDWLSKTVTLDDGQMYEIISQMEHDPHAFTQGLTFGNDTLWESTGLWGQSTVRILDKDTGGVIRKVAMDKAYFGEGMTFYGDNQLVQITWKSQEGFVYDATTLQQTDEFHFESTRNEGWGITWDECKDEFIVTDGSPFLHFWDPYTFTEKRKVQVFRRNGSPARELNEIEFWRGRVLANVWFEDVLLVIHPETGVVEKEYNFEMLWNAHERASAGADVFNGISVSEDPDILYVTGKKWNRLFKVRLLAEKP